MPQKKKKKKKKKVLDIVKGKCPILILKEIQKHTSYNKRLLRIHLGNAVILRAI